MEITPYPAIRDAILPADVIAFGGKGELSSVIKWATRSLVSHVGIVLHAKDWAHNRRNMLIESTSLNGFTGVTVSLLSDRLRQYDGDVWWLPLDEEARGKLDLPKFQAFCYDQEGKPYDTMQAIGAGLGSLTSFVDRNKEDFGKFFCSELDAGALEAGGVIQNINASEVTPIDLCMFNLYEGLYQLKGKPRDLKGFNSTDPEGFGF